MKTTNEKNEKIELTYFKKKWKVFVCLIIAIFIISVFVYKAEYENGNVYFNESTEQVSLCNRIYKGLRQDNNFNKFNKNDLLSVIKAGKFSHHTYWNEESSDETKELGYLIEEKLGIEWGNLYQNYYLEKGFTHYSIEPFNESTTIEYNNPIDENSVRQYYIYPDITMHHYVIKLYNRYEEKDIFLEKQETFEEAFNLFTTKKLRISEESTSVMPIYCGLATILSESYSIPDPLYFAMHNYIEENGIMGLSDFIYFSLVAITSFGFGDIVPVSFISRLFVILEALIGILIFGLMTSFVWMIITQNKNDFKDISNKNADMNQQASPQQGDGEITDQMEQSEDHEIASKGTKIFIMGFIFIAAALPTLIAQFSDRVK